MREEMIFKDFSAISNQHFVYNRFLDRWLKEK